MSGYKKNATSNRDALFGGAATTSSSSRNAASSSAPTSSRRTAPTETTTGTSQGYNPPATSTSTSSNNLCAKKRNPLPLLSADARAAKTKEAQDYRTKANECMKTGFFKRPDPGAAAIYFKRAADAYHQLGDNTLERLFRVESGACNMQCHAWASAASDYTRAAELLLQETTNETTDTNTADNYEDTTTAAAASIVSDAVHRRDAAAFYKIAASAWTQMNEPAKAAASQVDAALALHSNYAQHHKHNGSTARLSKEALTGMEEAVEAHVPDPLNPYARYRQTGSSAFIDADSDETAETCSAETRALAQGHLVTRAYAHEPLQQLVHLLTEYGEYAAALYAAGAVSTVLKADGLSTLSLSRAYVVETILTLALGDAVAAEQQFLNRHCQDTFYLKSRECQLAEELFRSVKMRDLDALDTARSIAHGPNRTALANLPHESLRATVQDLRISGMARKSNAGSSTSKSDKPDVSLSELLRKKTGYEQEGTDDAGNLDPESLNAELDDLDIGESDDDDEGKNDVDGLGGDDELDALEDDDIDLR